MPLSPRQLCANLAQMCGNQSAAYYQENVLAFLCNIASGAGYEHVVLCDADTGLPVIVRYLFNSSGELSSEENAISAFNVDGTEYTGDVADLIACSGGDGGGDSPLLQADYQPAAEIDFAVITGAFTVIYVNNENLVYVLIVNKTDQVVELSLNDGTDVHIILDPNESRTLNFASNRRRHSDDILIRYQGATAPTSGSVKIEAYA